MRGAALLQGLLWLCITLCITPSLPVHAALPLPEANTPHEIPLVDQHAMTVQGAHDTNSQPPIATLYLDKDDVLRMDTEIRTYSDFAYVMMHYEGTPKDDEYVLGLRVLVKSIKLTRSTHDVVVLVSQNVRPSTVRLLTEDGCIVRLVPNIPNPYKEAMLKRRTYKPRFEHTFNKLYLWNMTEYKRVLYMDADNVALENMDELFKCGHLCAVMMNPLYFHTGLMVIKPDLKLFNHLLDVLRQVSVDSYDGADQGFLTAHFTGMDAAPLFDQNLLKAGELAEAPMMRLAQGHNINHVYFYNMFDWKWFRLAAGRQFAHLPVPALSMGFPISPLFKPWYWYGTIYFDCNWHWHKIRAQLNESQPGFWLRFALISAGIYAFRTLMLWYIRNRPASRRPTLFFQITARFPRASSIVIGLVTVLCCVVPPGLHTICPRLFPPYVRSWLLDWRFLVHYVAFYPVKGRRTDSLGDG